MEQDKLKKALVMGAGGFIGSHMVKRLKKEGFWVRGVDLKYPEYAETAADEFVPFASVWEMASYKTAFNLWRNFHSVSKLNCHRCINSNKSIFTSERWNV